jgi:hypothetical protein
LFAVFCLRLLLLAARAGLSAPVSLTSLETGRLAVGVLPRDVRDVEAMPSALEGGAGEARGGVLLSMAGDLVPAPALRERTSCLHEPHRQSSRHVHLHFKLGRWWQAQTTHALRTHSKSSPSSALSAAEGPARAERQSAARPPHFERQPRSLTQPITLPTLCDMHTNHIAGLHNKSSHLGSRDDDCVVAILIIDALMPGVKMLPSQTRRYMLPSRTRR